MSEPGVAPTVVPVRTRRAGGEGGSQLRGGARVELDGLCDVEAGVQRSGEARRPGSPLPPLPSPVGSVEYLRKENFLPSSPSVGP